MPIAQEVLVEFHSGAVVEIIPAGLVHACQFASRANQSEFEGRLVRVCELALLACLHPSASLNRSLVVLLTQPYQGMARKGTMKISTTMFYARKNN